MVFTKLKLTQIKAILSRKKYNKTRVLNLNVKNTCIAKKSQSSDNTYRRTNSFNKGGFK